MTIAPPPTSGRRARAAPPRWRRPPSRTAREGGSRAAAQGGRAIHGFTLVEVLVALSIVAIALLAGGKAVGALLQNAERQSEVLLGHLCAENVLTAVRLSRQMPAIGDSVQACEQAGQQFDVKLVVRPTPNPSFRRVDAQVVSASGPVLRLSTIVGRR